MRPEELSGTSRRSRLFEGPWLAHADLHNHTALSDGDGDPDEAFGSMRAAGLDVAALTDHAVLTSGVADMIDLPFVRAISGIDDQAWRRLGALADRAQDDGAFVALRGFEWSNPLLGHINVWGTERYTDPLHTLGPTVSPFYRWLDEAGTGAPASFNHPGRNGPLRFTGFRYSPAVVDGMIGFEIFNKTFDYLYEGTDKGRQSPLVACLDAGWRPGLLGVSDEHGTDWGMPEGKGRAGLYVNQLTRAGVLDALHRRRFFATRHKDLRFDAAVNGVRMGGTVSGRAAALRVQVDIDRGDSWWGKPLNVQVLVAGDPLPRLAASVDVRVPRPDQPMITFDTRLYREEAWAVVRVTDPHRAADPRAKQPYAALGEAVAYASPFWFTAPSRQPTTLAADLQRVRRLAPLRPRLRHGP